MADEIAEGDDLPRALTAEELADVAHILAWPSIWTIRAVQRSLDRAAIRRARLSSTSI